MTIMSPFAYRVMKFGIPLAAVRIGVLWFLAFREAAHQQSLAELPLILLLYPEGLVLPKHFAWTAGREWAFSVALLVGSLLLAALVVRAAQFLRW